MLDLELQQEITDKAQANEVRRKDVLINMDDLDENIRTKLNNSVIGSGAYVDTELRNRIVVLENNQIAKANVFDKTKDHVNRDLLSPELQQAYDKVADVDGKSTKEYVDVTFRRKDVPIAEDQMDQNFQDKFTGMVQKVNSMSIIASDAGNINEKLVTLQNTVNSLSSSKLDKTVAERDYYQKSTPIPISALENSAKTSLEKIPTIETTLNSKANTTYVDNNFRRKDVSITFDDLNADLAHDIELCKTSATNLEASAKIVIEDYYQGTILPNLVNTYGSTGCLDESSKTFSQLSTSEKIDALLYYLYPYTFAESAAAYIGTKDLPSTDSRAGKTTFTGIFNYLYNLINSNKTSLNNSISANTNNISSLQSKVSSLETEVSSLKTQISSLQSSISSLSSRVAVLEAKP